MPECKMCVYTYLYVLYMHNVFYLISMYYCKLHFSKLLFNYAFLLHLYVLLLIKFSCLHAFYEVTSLVGRLALISYSVIGDSRASVSHALPPLSFIERHQV